MHEHSLPPKGDINSSCKKSSTPSDKVCHPLPNKVWEGQKPSTRGTLIQIQAT